MTNNEDMKREIQLYIDTSDSKKIIVRIIKDGQDYEAVSSLEFSKSEVVLDLLNKVLEKAGISSKDIDKITVHKGPGSFTGLRVGAAIANTLSFALLKPVNDLELGEIEVPEY